MPREIKVKSVLNTAKKRDSWFLDSYTFNPYSSCSFNCLYCYIRGSKYDANLEKSLSVKTNAIELLDKQLTLRAKKGQYGVIVLSSATDPYLNIEKKYTLTRDALSVILKHRFPVHIITKSTLVERDFDLLKKIEAQAILPEDLRQLGRGMMISFSFSSLQDDVASIFEPGAPAPSEKMKTLQTSLREGFLTGVSLMPLIPYISDTSEHLHHAFSTFKNAGVDYVLAAPITLFGHQKSDSRILMLGAIRKYYPELLEKYTRFFSNDTELPYYYRKAFYRKIKELCADYDLENDILKAAMKKSIRTN